MTDPEPTDLDESSAAAPWFRIVAGVPTDEELAALSVVLRARTTAASTSAGPGISGWSAYARTRRSLGRPGPGAWVMSARGR